jgi:subtilisin family serine protease
MRRVVALLSVLAVVFGAGAAAARADTHGSATVTLITGDRVTLTPSSQVIVDPAQGRGGFDVLRRDGHVRVIPNRVAGLVGDVLDPALFDVTALVDMGYDDAHRRTLPLIVRGGAATLRAGTALSSIGARATELRKSDAARFGDTLARPRARTAVGRIWLDRKLEADTLDGYLDQVRAPAAWNAGLDGAGVKVAVLDTGVDDEHPALAGQVDAEQNFTDEPSAEDGHGHGTHVASLLAGTGAGSDGARHGIAAGADLISGKVLGDDGAGQMSWVIAGMEWAAAQGADVVNLSLGATSGTTDDPVIESLEHLTASTGTLFVVAAGNDGTFGPSPYTIASPGSAESALTVGAVSGSDVLAFFSSEGPTRNGHRLKPDVLAPGIGILGARAGARLSDLYLPMTGTSQATPIVAGAAALLIQEHPDWTGQRVKSQLVATAHVLPVAGAWEQGGGRLDLEQATREELTPDLASLGFGMLRHPDEAHKTRKVALRNDGSRPVTLTIADQERSDRGAVAPAGALVASPATITVPAGGTATTTVTLRPELLDDGLWNGSVSFNDGDATVVHLPFGVYDEPERYDLDVQVLDRDGRPYDPATGADDPNASPKLNLQNAETGAFYGLEPDAQGHVTARIPPGTYSLTGRIVTPARAGHQGTFTVAGTPELEVRSDTRYVMDARAGERLRPPTLEGQETEPRMGVGVVYSRHSESGSGNIVEMYFDPGDVSGGRVYVTPTEEVSTGSFEATFRWRLEPTGRIRPGAPDAYDLVFHGPRFPHPLSPRLSRSDVDDLARVDTTYRPIGPAGDYIEGIVYATRDTGVGFVTGTSQPVPGATRRLVTADRDVRWGHCLYPAANAYRQHCGDLLPYGRGERADIQFGAALHPEVFNGLQAFGTLMLDGGLGDGQATSLLDDSAVESSRYTLYRNDELVGTVDGAWAHFPVADEPAHLRLVQEWRLADAFSRSRDARTVWDVDFDPAIVDQLPFLAVDYGAEVDGFGRAAPRKPLRLRLWAGHIPLSTTGPDRIDELTLQWSVDGGTHWQRAAVKRETPATFRGTVPGKELRSGRDVSLRLTATDAAGNAIDQTVDGIIPVR